MPVLSMSIDRRIKNIEFSHAATFKFEFIIQSKHNVALMCLSLILCFSTSIRL